jgi:ABC-type transporter Mla subunit MlaD
MKKDTTPPRTYRDAFAAQVLGEIDTLLDKVKALTGTINETGEKIQVTINQLEGAGEKYNQAVLAANLRFKNETIAYLKTVTTTSIAKTLEKQQELVQELIRKAVSNEITTLKKVLSESHVNYRPPFLTRWGGLLIAAFIGSAITITLIKY